jgi:OPA family glycerol-3-phosphate transporter-like MFS transporter
VLRNGIMHWGTIFSKDVGIIDTDLFFVNWGLVLMLAGVTGGFFAGFISDKIFGSRRGPSAFFLYAGMFAGFVTLIFAVRLDWHFLIGFLSFFMSMCVIGVHGMLSGTASMDFGGKKAAATTAGVIDGFVYLGTGVQSVCLGYIIPNFGWNAWPIFLIPFTLIGLFFTRRIWNAFPDAKKRGGH